MFYFLNFLLVIIYYYIIINSGGNKENKFWVLFAIHAILFRALANPYNYVDTVGYGEAFLHIASMSLGEAMTSLYAGWGLGYVFINWLISRFTETPEIFFAIISIISVGGVIWFYSKTSYNAILTAVIYLTYPMLYLMGFGVIRQHLAVVFVLITLYYIDDKRIAIPLSLLAVLMHTSAIVFIPFFFWRKIRFEKLNVFVILILAVIGVVVGRYMMGFILSYLPRYMDSGFGEEGNNNIVPIFVLGSLFIMLFITKIHKKSLSNRDMNIISFITYGFMVSLFSFGISGAGRLTLPFIYTVPTAITFLNKYSRSAKAINNAYILVILVIITLLIFMSFDPINYEYIRVGEQVIHEK